MLDLEGLMGGARVELNLHVGQPVAVVVEANAVQ